MTSPAEIAKMIDHSILHPTMTDKDLNFHCQLAAKYQVATVCVKPYHTKQAAELLRNSGVGICSVIGFPHGNSTTEIKVAETLNVIKNGAKEVDMVINIGKALQSDWNYVENEIKQINEVCLANSSILKVIFETDFVTKTEDKIRLCKICNRQMVAFVKTSTGYGFVKDNDGKYFYNGAQEEDLILFRKHCLSSVQIKAAGGIRTLEQVLRARDLGVTRIGASATEQIMNEAFKKFTQG